MDCLNAPETVCFPSQMCLIRTQVHCTVPIKISNYPLGFFSGSAPGHTYQDVSVPDKPVGIRSWISQEILFCPKMVRELSWDLVLNIKVRDKSVKWR